MEYDIRYLIRGLAQRHLHTLELHGLYKGLTNKAVRVEKIKVILKEEGYDTVKRIKFMDLKMIHGRWYEETLHRHMYINSMYRNSTNIYMNNERVIASPKPDMHKFIDYSGLPNPEDWELFCWMMFNTTSAFRYEEILKEFPEYETVTRLGKVINKWDTQTMTLKKTINGRQSVIKLILTDKKSALLAMSPSEAYHAFFYSAPRIFTRRQV